MKFERSSGVLLHPTSLPGPYGIGDLGPPAYRWLDFLAGAGCKLWQVLPLGPTGYGDSPYQSFSAFAGNLYMISPDLLIQDGLLAADDLADMPQWNEEAVDFGGIFNWKPALLNKAHARFIESGSSALQAEYRSFCDSNAGWLEDFALFMAIKDDQGGGAWNTWEKSLRQRKPKALAEARKKLADAVARHKFRQWLFFKQWHALRAYAHAKGIRIIGDIPIFIALDSADAWSHSDLFFMDEAGRPTVVAGVPPDYFSRTGQLWGNPLYRWEVHKATGYKWWIERIEAILKLVDIVRIDHFRGFAGYWEVPGDAATAEHGRWVPGPGADFFNAVHSALSGGAAAGEASLNTLPIIAEDLGEITPDVIALRDGFHLPGMKILQFAFSGPDNAFLPHHYVANCVAYTGTHDNDTSRGWYDSAPQHEKDFARRYLSLAGEPADFAGDLIRSVWSSVAVFALTPMQDWLNLDTQARMNYPGRASGNWAWRVRAEAMNEALRNRLRELNYLYQR